MMDVDVFRLNKEFWDFAFDNPEKIKPVHCAIYFFALEHCNRMGWKEKFGFPSQMVMDAIGLKTWRSYKNALEDLVTWGFLIMIERSKNQYSANIIAIDKKSKALSKALSKATLKHSQKHYQKQSEYNKYLIPNTNNLLPVRKFFEENHSVKYQVQFIQKNSALPADEFNHFLEQFILSREEDGAEYDDPNQVIAGLQKYINSCSKSYHERQQQKDRASRGNNHPKRDKILEWYGER